MENMQDILKKYYSSGGKDLFEAPEDYVTGENDPLNPRGGDISTKLPKEFGDNARPYFPVKLQKTGYDNVVAVPDDLSPSFDYFGAEEGDAEFRQSLDKLKESIWPQNASDMGKLRIDKGAQRFNQFKQPVETVIFSNKEPELAGTSDSPFGIEDPSETVSYEFQLEVVCFKACDDLRRLKSYNRDSKTSFRRSVTTNYGVGKGDAFRSVFTDKTPIYYMQPTMMVTFATENLQVFDVVIILKHLADFLGRDAQSRNVFKDVYFEKNNKLGTSGRVVQAAAQKIPNIKIATRPVFK